MNFYSNEKQEILDFLESTENGITSEAAEKKLLSDGKNKLDEGKKDSLFTKFVKQLANPMIIVLLAAAIISLATAIYTNESFADVIIILSVVILNSVLGVLQESKAEKAIEALKEMTSSKTKVIRDGIIKIIKSEDLVAGDVIILEAGDAVPADGRIIECASMKVDESTITGESVPVNKEIAVLEGEEIALGDRSNMIYMGSTVVYGRGKAVIVSTGMNTEMGKIANIITSTKNESTPLQIKLNQLSKILTILVLIICVLMFVVSLFKQSFSASVVLDTLVLSISLAVAAIPEGLAAVVTILLSIGVTKMSKQNAVIRKLTAVETLGCTQIICSDKTGTLTQNKMTVTDKFTTDEKLLSKAMALCSDAKIVNNETIGEPTECALVNYANKLQLHKDDLEQSEPRVDEAPFDSMRKMMSTIHQIDNKFIQYTKGALDEIIKRSKYYLSSEGIVPLTTEIKETILKQNKDFSNRALRVLAGSYKEYSTKPTFEKPDDIECDLIFIGFVGMIDPIRPEVKQAISECYSAGIKVIMITGDHIDTARAIAKDLNIIESEDQALLGSELNNLSDEELSANIDKYRVFARVQPEHKVRIVKAWKSQNMIVAMTGDGVNDAPSIKSADIGIGMGITGTDVTKNVADMILADDNFATIVSAVSEGRKIYNNIRKSIQFLLSSNLSEVISIFIATILGFTILDPAHILWINLITDSLPALALGMEENEKNVMHEKPRKATESIFANGMIYDIIYQGLFVAMLTLFAFFIGEYIENGSWAIKNSHDGKTMAFLTMSMAEIFQSFNMRSQKGSIFTVKKQNKFLWLSALAAIVLTTSVIYIPFLKDMFGFTDISAMEYFIALGLGFAIIPLVEIVKLLQHLFRKKA